MPMLPLTSAQHRCASQILLRRIRTTSIQFRDGKEKWLLYIYIYYISYIYIYTQSRPEQDRQQHTTSIEVTTHIAVI